MDETLLTSGCWLRADTLGACRNERPWTCTMTSGCRESRPGVRQTRVVDGEQEAGRALIECSA